MYFVGHKPVSTRNGVELCFATSADRVFYSNDEMGVVKYSHVHYSHKPIGIFATEYISSNLENETLSSPTK